MSFGNADNAGADRKTAAALSGSVSLAPSGNGDGFHYEQVPSTPGVYSVTFSDNGGIVLVSDSFLGLVVNHNGMTPDIKRKALRSYPEMVATNFDTIVNSTFPDQSQAPAGAPFEGFQCTDVNGSLVTVAQDSLASPYVRVTVKDKNGTTESFTINRKFVDDLLRQEDMDASRLASSITTFPFRLPEDTRFGFANLSREQLNDIVLRVPAFQRQEIIRMPRFYREKAPEILAKLSNAPPRVASEAVVSNTPAPASAQDHPNIRRLPSASIDRTVPQKPNAAPPLKANQDKRHPDWLGISGWVVAAAAILWALSRRKR